MSKKSERRSDKRKGRKTIRERRVNKTEIRLPSYSVEDAIPIFIHVKKAKNLKDRTLKDYEINLRYFVEWLNEKGYGNLCVDEISIQILREYVLWLANDKKYYEGHPFKSNIDKLRRGLSPSSVNVRIRVLKSFFSTLYQEEIISRSPADNLSLMRQEEDTVQPLTEEELQRLLDAPDQRYFAQFRDYVILILMLDTGMRLNEICSLEIKDVDLRSRQIVLPGSKNKNRRLRVLPLSIETSKLLMQLILESKEYFDSEYVFNTYYGEKVNEKTIQKAFYKYAEKAGIERRVSPHILRHNFAKMAALNGMDIFTLQKILGHREISTTRKYVQIDDHDLKNQHSQYSPVARVLKRRSKL